MLLRTLLLSLRRVLFALPDSTGHTASGQQAGCPCTRSLGVWRSTMLLPWLAVVASVVPGSVAQGDDWPQWLGPQRDSVWRETEIVERIPESGPVVRWRVPISGGYTGPAVAAHRVFVMDYLTDGERTASPDARPKLAGKERVLCLDAATGKVIWTHEYDCPYEISYPAGPRATPTVDGDLVYTLGSEGDLRCLTAADGRLVWAKSFKKDFQAKTPLWGFCGHPLVDGEKLICIVGGPGRLVMALDKRTGNEIWRSLDAEQPGYSAPTIVQAGGVRQLLIWHSAALASLNPESGDVYWSEKLDPNYGMSIVTPRLDGDLLFVGGIIHKSMMVRLDERRPTATVAWMGSKEVGIDPVHSTPFPEKGVLYGVSREGALSAVQMANGSILWQTFDLMPDARRAHSGTIFLVKHEDRFLLMTDSGELVIARLTPEGHQWLSRTPLLETTSSGMGRSVVWSHPAFADRCLFARNDKEILCVSLSSEDYTDVTNKAETAPPRRTPAP